MTREVVSVRPDTTFKDCAEMVRIHRVGAFPVVDGEGRLLGILTESDLLRKEELKNGGEDPRATARTAAEAMTRAVVSVTADQAVAEAARLMHQSSVRHLPVTDKSGRLIGIVARADLLKVFLRSDESIRREIDEVLLPRTFGIPPGTVAIDVRGGVVLLQGQVETRSLARLVAAFAERVEGVVGVDDELGYVWDDRRARVATAID